MKIKIPHIKVNGVTMVRGLRVQHQEEEGNSSVWLERGGKLTSSLDKAMQEGTWSHVDNSERDIHRNDMTVIEAIHDQVIDRGIY